ncbi:Probable transmembrane protein [Sphingobium indicum BiD32]|uniref:GDT1 family protein n=2 Tax=Sphingobium indicum TaxID=332055 RepID=N1MTK4_9SPHN|nr:Probable transmembrane protein [Sphingobium indicum BiD32]
MASALFCPAGRRATVALRLSLPPGPGHLLMEALSTSAALVALAEMGDKTQLLAMLLATRFRKPVPIIFGILVATIANHFLAALLGHSIAGVLTQDWFRYAVALSFIAMAAWTLVPDKIDEDAPLKAPSKAGVFVTTLVAFFLVEMGDKTQVATIALGARFDNLVAVTMGTTLGMMLANVPAVLFGEALAKKVPMRALQVGAALLFLLLGLWMIADLAGWIG